MTYIILDDQQARIVTESREAVVLRDRQGRHLGYLSHGFTEEDLSVARERLASSSPRHTTADVLNHLRSLETANTIASSKSFACA